MEHILRFSYSCVTKVPPFLHGWTTHTLKEKSITVIFEKANIFRNNKNNSNRRNKQWQE